MLDCWQNCFIIKIMKTTQKLNHVSPHIFRTILEEIRLLRHELAFLYPQDELRDYAHPARLKRSYQKALKRYPPVNV